MEMEKVQALLDQSRPVSTVCNKSMMYKMTPDRNLLAKYACIIQVGNIPESQCTWLACCKYALDTTLPNIGVNIRFLKPTEIALDSSFRAFELLLVDNGNDNSEADETYAKENRALRVQVIGKNGQMQISDWKVCTPGFFNFTDDGGILENIPSLPVKDKTLKDILVAIIEIADQSVVKWAMPNVRNEHAEITFGKLYESREESGDIELTVGGCKIMAHKLILTAKSQVFKNMFGIDMKEKQLGQAEIEDFDPIIISELIKYLYTGLVNLEGYALELYRCANKYDILELMELCQSYIGYNIPIYEWKELFGLLQIYGDRILTLKNGIKGYLDSNLSDLRSSKEFEEAVDMFPEVFKELFYSKKQKLG